MERLVFHASQGFAQRTEHCYSCFIAGRSATGFLRAPASWIVESVRSLWTMVHGRMVAVALDLHRLVGFLWQYSVRH